MIKPSVRFLTRHTIVKKNLTKNVSFLGLKIVFIINRRSIKMKPNLVAEFILEIKPNSIIGFSLTIKPILETSLIEL